MGLFGKLFEKKNCAFCGKDIGLLGNRKLEDGNMCKVCASKLSPWFSERRNSTVEEIRGQLEYREANLEKLSSFHVTRTLGNSIKLLIDEDADVFVLQQKRNLQEENPDIIAFSDVTGCTLDIEEDRYEMMKEDASGNEISYSPKRFMNQFDFYVTIHVNHPYFNEMRFKLNDSTVEIEEQEKDILSSFLQKTPKQSREYTRYLEMGEEITNIFTQAREQVREAAKPKATMVCPLCGATTMADEKGCCEFCGGPLR